MDNLISSILIRLIVGLFIGVTIVVYIYVDARKRAMSPVGWALIGFFFSLLGLIVYLLVRRDIVSRYCPICGRGLPQGIEQCSNHTAGSASETLSTRRIAKQTSKSQSKALVLQSGEQVNSLEQLLDIYRAEPRAVTPLYKSNALAKWLSQIGEHEAARIAEKASDQSVEQAFDSLVLYVIRRSMASGLPSSNIARPEMYFVGVVFMVIFASLIPGLVTYGVVANHATEWYLIAIAVFSWGLPVFGLIHMLQDYSRWNKLKALAERYGISSNDTLDRLKNNQLR